MPKTLRAIGVLVLVVPYSLFVSACSRQSASPTAPSSSSSEVPPPPQGATITGVVSFASGPASSVAVGVEASTVSAVSDAAGNFVLANVPAADVVLTFTAPGVAAALPLGTVSTSDRIHVNVTLSGSAATLDSQEHMGTSNVVDADGTIENLHVTTRTFVLGGVTVNVAADAVIRRGSQPVDLASLSNGDRVHVHGTKNGSAIDASEVIAQVNTPAPPNPDVTLKGVVASLTGTCPALSMTVGGALVKTGSATVFNAKACAELENGDTVYAIGPKQSDGSVLASKIYYVAPTPPPAPTPTPAPNPDVTLKGDIAGLTGTCPALSMTVGGAAVKTGSATVFNAKTCAELKNGDTVYAIGPKQSDGSVLASKIYYVAPTPPPAPAPTPNPDVTLKGDIAGLTGTCPALSMTVGGAAVKTSSATVFNVKTCAELKNGDTVYAIGPKQSDGAVLASKIYYVTPPSPSPIPVYVSGIVDGRTGTCPSLSLSIGGTVVKTNASTVFGGKACADIVIGSQVNTRNLKQSDGTLLATDVQVVK